MKSIKLFSTAGIIMILLGIASLACNLPVDILRIQEEIKDSDDAESIREIVAEYDATLVSSEGEIVGLPFDSATKWVCKDIDGEISFFKENAELAPESYILKKAVLDLTLTTSTYDDRKQFHIDYLLNLEIDEGYLNVEGNAIEQWNHTKLSGKGREEVLPPTVDERSRTGVLDVTVIQEDTFPSELSQEYVRKHHFFVLFPPGNYNIAYFCDVGANPVPAGWDKLTGENFRDFCPYYYYECYIKEP